MGRDPYNPFPVRHPWLRFCWWLVMHNFNRHGRFAKRLCDYVDSQFYE